MFAKYLWIAKHEEIETDLNKDQDSESKEKSLADVKDKELVLETLRETFNNSIFNENYLEQLFEVFLPALEKAAC